MCYNAYIDNKNKNRHEITKKLWEKLSDYRVFVSDLVIEEIEATGDEMEKKQLVDLVKEI